MRALQNSAIGRTMARCWYFCEKLSNSLSGN